MDFYGRKHLIDIEYEDPTAIYGVLKKSKHKVRILTDIGQPSDNVICYLQIGNKKTFDRWANSVDFEFQILNYIEPDSKKKLKLIQKDIDEAIKLACLCFRKIPTKYWNRFLRIKW